MEGVLKKREKKKVGVRATRFFLNPGPQIVHSRIMRRIELYQVGQEVRCMFKDRNKIPLGAELGRQGECFDRDRFSPDYMSRLHIRMTPHRAHCGRR